jgi:hypothetical protein
MENIKLEPDFDLLRKYIKNARIEYFTEYHTKLLSIKDFDNRFCELFEDKKLIPHLSNIYYFAGDFKLRIDAVSNGKYLKRNQQSIEYIEQYNRLMDLIYWNTPKTILLKHNKPEFVMSITNKTLLEQVLRAISTIEKPTIQETIKTGKPDNDTFNRQFIKYTKCLYRYLHEFEGYRLNEAADFTSKLLFILDTERLEEKYNSIEQFETHILDIYSKKE